MAKRAANGMGTIRQRSDGRWEARYTAPDGKQRSVYAATRTKCAEALRQVQAQITIGGYVAPNTVTVKDWIETWLKDYTVQMKPSTKHNYERVTNKHIIPAIGSIKLNKLKTSQVQQMINTMSPSTQSYVRTVLSSALKMAESFELINSNPCNGVRVRKPEKVEKCVIDREQIPDFVRLAYKTLHGDALLVLLQTGMRFGELRGLRWEDIDFENKCLYIRRQLAAVGDEYVIQSTKTGKPRKIALMDDTVEILKQHKIKQNRARLRAGGWDDNEITKDLVFRMPNGNHYSRATLKWAIHQIGVALGLKGLHVHSLRDSYAVAALRSGIDVKTVQNNLGHANAAMTLDVYAQYTDDMGQMAAEKLAAYWHDSTKSGSN